MTKLKTDIKKCWILNVKNQNWKSIQKKNFKFYNKNWLWKIFNIHKLPRLFNSIFYISIHLSFPIWPMPIQSKHPISTATDKHPSALCFTFSFFKFIILFISFFFYFIFSTPHAPKTFKNSLLALSILKFFLIFFMYMTFDCSCVLNLFFFSFSKEKK